MTSGEDVLVRQMTSGLEHCYHLFVKSACSAYEYDYGAVEDSVSADAEKYGYSSFCVYGKCESEFISTDADAVGHNNTIDDGTFDCVM